MYYMSYKNIKPHVYLAELVSNNQGKGPRFVIYNCQCGLLTGEEYYLFDEQHFVLRIDGLNEVDYEREIIGFADTEEESFEIGNSQ